MPLMALWEGGKLARCFARAHLDGGRSAHDESYSVIPYNIRFVHCMKVVQERCVPTHSACHAGDDELNFLFGSEEHYPQDWFSESLIRTVPGGALPFLPIGLPLERVLDCGKQVAPLLNLACWAFGVTYSTESYLGDSFSF